MTSNHYDLELGQLNRSYDRPRFNAKHRIVLKVAIAKHTPNPGLIGVGGSGAVLHSSLATV
jgi:hypothetical protein